MVYPKVLLPPNFIILRRLQRHRIMAFCHKWLTEEQGLDEQQKSGFRKAVKELHGLLAEL